MKRIISILIIGILIQSCSPKIRSHLTTSKFLPIEKATKIIVIEEEENIPNNSDFVGDLKIGDSGFSTDCGYEKVIESAKLTARKSGANLIKLTEIKRPNFVSTCYRIKAKMYRNLNDNILSELITARELRNKSRLPKDADYAVVYFYRPRNFAGSAIGYKIRLDDDTVIGRVRNGEKFEFKTNNFGEHTFWGRTESRDSVSINIGKGQEYFVRCGIKMGVAIGKPEIYLIENHIGIKEYEGMK